MEPQKIEYIMKGWGESATFFSTKRSIGEAYKVDEIKEETKIIGKGYYNDLEMIVYRGYVKDKCVFEIAAGNDVTLVYK